jgi:serine protease Do
MMFNIRIILITIAAAIALVTSCADNTVSDLARDRAGAVVLILRDTNTIDGLNYSGLGAGFFIGPNVIVTNTHVIDGADTLSVRSIHSQVLFDAVVIAKNYTTDIALIKLVDWPQYTKVNSVDILEFASSRDLTLGETVWSIGHPWGLYWSVSSGIVSFPSRRIDGTLMNYIQTDAVIQQGNSGGPLLNTHGEVVGIVSKIFSPTMSGGFGLAVPSDIVVNTVNYMKNNQPVEFAIIGIDLAQSFDNKQVVVTDLLDWPSTRGLDIRVGDRLIEITTPSTGIRGAKIRSVDDFINELVITSPGDQITLTLLRGDHQLFVTVTADGLIVL